MSFDSFDSEHFIFNIYHPKIVLVSLIDPNKEKVLCLEEKDFEKTIWMIVKNFKIKRNALIIFLAKFGFLDQLKYFGQTTNIPFPQKFFNQILRSASEAGHFSCVEYALEQGADIHTFQDYALRHAAHGGFLELVKYLVEQGADITADDYGAQKWAIERNHMKVAEYLNGLRKK